MQSENSPLRTETEEPVGTGVCLEDKAWKNPANLEKFYGMTKGKTYDIYGMGNAGTYVYVLVKNDKGVICPYDVERFEISPTEKLIEISEFHTNAAEKFREELRYQKKVKSFDF